MRINTARTSSTPLGSPNGTPSPTSTSGGQIDPFDPSTGDPME